MCLSALDDKVRTIQTLKRNIDSPCRTMWWKLSVKLQAKQHGVILRRRKSKLIAAAIVPSLKGITDGTNTHISINAFRLKANDMS